MDLHHAFRTGSLEIVERAARRADSVSLRDALAILVMLADEQDPRYERAAARWFARLSSGRVLRPADAAEIWRLLDALPAEPEAAEAALHHYC